MTRRGYTLVEVLLALSLSVLLMALIAFAIDVYWRAVDAAEANVRESQIARAVLQRIAADLRAMTFEDAPEIDASAVPGASAEEGEGDEVEEMEEAMEDMLGEMASDLGVDATSNLATAPGIYGEADWILVDTHRPPGAAQATFGYITTEYGSQSDGAIKTVAYSLVYKEMADVDLDHAPKGSLAERMFTPGAAGLYRREFDRPVTLFAEENGTMTDYEAELVPLAPEIELLEFLYFDGEEWYEEWDMEEMGTTPVGVKVAVGVTPQASSAGRLGMSWRWRQEEDELEPIIYSLFVALPKSAAAEEEPASEEDAMGDADATTDAGGAP